MEASAWPNGWSRREWGGRQWVGEGQGDVEGEWWEGWDAHGSGRGASDELATDCGGGGVVYGSDVHVQRVGIERR